MKEKEVKIYLSEDGEVKELVHVSDTPKGYRVRGYFGEFQPKREYVVFRENPKGRHGSHAAFLFEDEAVSHARGYLQAEEERAWGIMERMEKKLDKLPKTFQFR